VKRGRRAKWRQVFICGHQLSGTGLLMMHGMVTSTVVEGFQEVDIWECQRGGSGDRALSAF
jgi:hypothetical protein